MLTRIVPVFMALLLVIAVAGCEGDAGVNGINGTDGTDGTDGQDGDAVVLAFGTVAGNALVFTTSWPDTLSGSPVTFSVQNTLPGQWTVTLQTVFPGTFPSTEGTVIVSNNGSFFDVTMSAVPLNWSATDIAFWVFAVDVATNMRQNVAQFSFVVLAP
ncbi:MAG: hypothetical protein IH969_01305 [Candidatus Krumholzibacteriota bacterium]|nr:hypothetical protein [Candidatus Krumholzibacteriota bacterium]